LAHRGARHLSVRVAIYYAPERDDPLWEAGCRWLGRDPDHAVTLAQPALDGIAEVTAAARSYGFHCTLKPPLRLATSYADLRDDVLSLARSLRPFDLPPLAVADLSGFLALRETAPSPELQALADACVAWLDRHRQPPDAAELQRRRGRGLAPDADALLLRWGYPGVFGRWQFHMTLTRRLLATEQPFWREAIERHFESALPISRGVRSLCLFSQATPAAPFVLAERFPLG
jgi:hypothetical protein